MKLTGIVRRTDNFGRIVLPKELRMTHNINENDLMEIFVGDHDGIILKKYETACIFCSSMNDIFTYNGHNVCLECLKKIAEKLKENQNHQLNWWYAQALKGHITGAAS